MKATRIMAALAGSNALATVGVIGWGLLQAYLWRMDALYLTSWYRRLDRDGLLDEVGHSVDGYLFSSVLPLVVVSVAWLVLAACAGLLTWRHKRAECPTAKAPIGGGLA